MFSVEGQGAVGGREGGGSVCIQTGRGRGWSRGGGGGTCAEWSPGGERWATSTRVLAPLWDVTVGELRLFSGITEILAEIERNWKRGRQDSLQSDVCTVLLLHGH